MTDPIKIDGLQEFARNLRRLDSELPKMLRVGLNEIADVVVADAKPSVPSRSGKARSSIKAKSTRTAVRVAAGGARVPYYPWLDFGGQIGSQGSRRPYRKHGRYLYASYFRNRSRMVPLLEEALIKTARSAGLEVEGG